MSNVFAIHSVGQSLVTYLTNSYPQSLRDKYDCSFVLVSSPEIEDQDFTLPAVTLFLYRVTMNEHLRTMRRGPELPGDVNPLSVDLHYLLSVWALKAPAEHVLLAWAMRQLHLHPLLDSSALSPEAGWLPSEFIEVVPSELPTEDVMRIWDAFDTPYRLSVSYTARVVRITGEEVAPAPPVVARRFGFGDHVEALPL